MCGGPTATQDQLQQEEADFYQTQIQAYNTAYANFSAISSALNAQFAPIVAAGPNQTGFSAPEMTTLNTQAVQGTATNYDSAETALNEGLAAEGSGGEGLSSGQTAQLRGELGSSAAATESSEELGIDQADYSQGYTNYENAVGGEEQLASGWNPNSFASSTTNSANSTNSEANAIAQEQESGWTSIIGALGGVAGGFAGDFSFGPSK